MYLITQILAYVIIIHVSTVKKARPSANDVRWFGTSQQSTKVSLSS